MIRTLCLGAALAVFAASPAAAQTRSDEVASCMISHSTEEDVAQMKQLMLLALQDRKDEATTALAGLMMQAGVSASSQCGVGFGEMTSPMFEAAMRQYGEHLGTIVMERAFTMMDLPMQ
ncbi:hypothetical protein HY29_16815 [Hyphomonas beringensis]|uniref:Uncharacterized protein n=1 Tax=Hyphomonas beringensis TaxID=1280946 RepID=A0A062TZU5_9PROT|nr:hypothetical protein [Hyphomonas beringensis]KCZ53576.1 hypothetical protein HY29_16815 [Hyphomonas beringensis]